MSLFWGVQLLTAFAGKQKKREVQNLRYGFQHDKIILLANDAREGGTSHMERRAARRKV